MIVLVIWSIFVLFTLLLFCLCCCFCSTKCKSSRSPLASAREDYSFEDDNSSYRSFSGRGIETPPLSYEAQDGPQLNSASELNFADDVRELADVDSSSDSSFEDDNSSNRHLDRISQESFSGRGIETPPLRYETQDGHQINSTSESNFADIRELADVDSSSDSSFEDDNSPNSRSLDSVSQGSLSGKGIETSPLRYEAQDGHQINSTSESNFADVRELANNNSFSAVISLDSRIMNDYLPNRPLDLILQPWFDESGTRAFPLNNEAQDGHQLNSTSESNFDNVRELAYVDSSLDSSSSDSSFEDDYSPNRYLDRISQGSLSGRGIETPALSYEAQDGPQLNSASELNFADDVRELADVDSSSDSSFEDDYSPAYRLL